MFMIGSTEVKNEKFINSNVYVVGPTGTGKNLFYTNPNVCKEEEKNLIVIDSKKEVYNATHHKKHEHGYQVLQLELLDIHFQEDLREILYKNQHQKFILYIHVNVLESTYEERGKQVQKLLHILIEQRFTKEMHIYFDEYEMYPIPNIAEFLCITRNYQMGISIIVQEHANLERIYGKEVARAVSTNCDTVFLLGINSMQDAEYFSFLSGRQMKQVQGEDRWVERPILTPSEILQSSSHEAFIFFRNELPKRMKKGIA